MELEDYKKLAKTRGTNKYVTDLNNEIHRISGNIPVDNTKTVIKNVTDVLPNPKEVQKVISGSDFTQKIANLIKARKASKGLPAIAAGAIGLGSALMSDESQASEQLPEGFKLADSEKITTGEVPASMYEQLPEVVERRKKALEMMNNNSMITN